MARTSGTQRKNSGSKNTTRNTTGSGRRTTSQVVNSKPRQKSEQERMISNEITLLLLLRPMLQPKEGSMPLT